MDVFGHWQVLSSVKAQSMNVLVRLQPHPPEIQRGHSSNWIERLFCNQ